MSVYTETGGFTRPKSAVVGPIFRGKRLGEPPNRTSRLEWDRRCHRVKRWGRVCSPYKSR